MSAPENPFAFPHHTTDGGFDQHHGMTLRDHFAGQALGRLAGNDDTRARASWTENPEADLAKWAYRVADAMLAERAKGQPRVAAGNEYGEIGPL